MGRWTVLKAQARYLSLRRARATTSFSIEVKEQLPTAPEAPVKPQ